MRGLIIQILIIAALIAGLHYMQDNTSLFSDMDPTVQAFMKDPLGTTQETVDAYNEKIQEAYGGIMDE